MKVLPTGLLTLLQAMRLPMLRVIVSFDVLGVYLTNNPGGLTYAGQAFTAAVFTIKGLGENFLTENQAATIEIGDVETPADDTFRDRFFGDLWRGEVVTIRVLYRTGGSWADTTLYQTLTCDIDATDPYHVTIRLGSSDSVQGTQVPRRTTQEAGCEHDYRHGLCPYRGALTSCDKGYGTPNGCVTHFPAFTIGGVTYTPPRPFGGQLGGTPQRLVVR